MRPFAIALALAVGAVIATSLATDAWHHAQPRISAGALGALHSVSLTNNQVYYGRLAHISHDSITLSRVFYVQVAADDKSGERTNKLVERATSDWHGPVSMTIPVDKIMFIEEVGSSSQVAKLIGEAEAHH